MQRVLCVVKPHAVAENWTFKILSRFEKKGLVLKGVRHAAFTMDQADSFYRENRGKWHHDRNLDCMTEGAVVAAVFEHEDAVCLAREIAGSTNPMEAKRGTVRADFGGELPKNAVHVSDSCSAAKREIGFFFSEVDVEE